jgi:SdiA-regulated
MALTAAQIAQTSADLNQGFEDLACDAANGKIYLITEKLPRRVWSLDVATGLFEIIIDVETLSSWTSQLSDLAGLTYDPVGKTLFVLSEESKRIVQSTLNGTLLGPSLSVANATAPEGLSFIPSTGELLVQSEPNQILRFPRKTSGLVCTPVAPTRAPVAPVNAPVAPVAPSAPAVAPVAPSAPVVAPMVPSAPAAPVAPSAPRAPTAPAAPIAPPASSPVVAPVASPVLAPVVAPVASPVLAPVVAPVAAPVTAPVAAPKAPVVAPKSPTKTPTKTPTKAPTRIRCGLFGFRIVCFNGCGIVGRLFRFCKYP